MTIRVKRIYDPPADSDGVRILVDRFWPQGISRYDAQIAFWEKDTAPTTELRKWFGQNPERWPEFRCRYRVELTHNPVAKELRKFARRRLVTLLYGARDQEHNHALVLAAFLRRPSRRQEAIKVGKTEQENQSLTNEPRSALWGGDGAPRLMFVEGRAGAIPQRDAGSRTGLSAWRPAND